MKIMRYFLLAFALGGIIFVSGGMVFAVANQWVIEKDATTSNLKFYYNDQAPSMTISTAGKVTATSFAGDGSALTNISAAGVPQGAVMFFNLASCPSGWIKMDGVTTGVPNAQGRYIVGLPASGTLAGTAGSALSNLENRAVGYHTHSISQQGHRHEQLSDTIAGGSLGSGSCNSSCLSQLANPFTTYAVADITINYAGSVVDTNAPYIQLLACQKS